MTTADIAGTCAAPTRLRGDLVLINKAAYDLGIPFTAP